MSEDIRSEGDQNPLDSILPKEEPRHAPPSSPTTNFAPWHLPRKQYVRKKQWADSLERLLNDLPDRGIVKYFGLPGQDLLDIETLASVCREKERRLRYLGFDESAQDAPRSNQRITAEQIVQLSGAIDSLSTILPDNFTAIAQQGSMAARAFRNGGSFDIVNLDMCDAFTTRSWSPTHRAILALLTHQTNRRGEPWLLCITTRTELSRIDHAEVEAYAEAIRRNSAASETFRHRMAEVAGIQDCADVEAFLGKLQRQLKDDNFLSGRWLAIGIGKWLLGIMGAGERWRLSLLSIFAYRTGLVSEDGAVYAGEPPNMFSLVFRFDKVRSHREDPAGLAQIHSGAPVEFSEILLAEKLVRTVKDSTQDLDRLLQTNTTLHDRLSEECAGLLGVRHYSAEVYREWVKKIPKIPD